MKVFKANLVTWRKPIEEVKIKGQTKQFIVLMNDKKVAKSSTYESYFDTRDEAKEYLVNRAKRQLKMAQEAGEAWEKELAKLEKL